MDLAQTDDPQERLEFALWFNTSALCSKCGFADFDDPLSDPADGDIIAWSKRVAPIYFARGWRGGPDGTELICPRCQSQSTSV